MTEDEMAVWHHRLNGHEFEWTPGVGDGQGGLSCCNSWGRRVGHDWATELNWTEPYPRWQYSSVESSRQQLSSPCKQVIFLNSVFCVQFLTKVKDNAQRPNYKHYQARQEVFQGLPQLLTTVRNTDIVSTSKKESDFIFTFHFHAVEKEMATHSSVLAWRIQGMGKPGGLPSMGLHRVGHDWSNLAEAAAAAKKKHGRYTFQYKDSRGG